MANPIITAWTAISPYGLGAEHFTDGLRTGRPARAVPGFDIEEALGRKGTFGMDRASALAVGTVGRLLDRCPPDTAVVLGTTSGSTQTQLEFARATWTRRKPYFVEPALMPFGLMNSPAAQCGLWHGLTGANTTIADGPVSGLTGLVYATRLLRAGRAQAVICGGVEELTPARAWLTGNPNLGEGCAALLIEPPATEKPALAEILRVDSRICLDGDLKGAVKTSLRELLADHDPTEVVAAAPHGEPDQAAVDELLGGAIIRPTKDLIGDTGGAASAFQLCALLAPQDRPGLAVVTATGPDGKVATALLRLH